MKKFLKFSIVLIVIGLIFGEVAFRIAGVSNVPLRRADNITGYIPYPNQQGKFMNNLWQINELSMISSRPFRSSGYEVLVAGDSVVFGGNPLDQSERVGERLDKFTPDVDVYSVADGSWGFKNSINYLLSNKSSLLGVEQVIFVLNSGDFDKPSSWRCESFHPTKPAFSALYFAIRKYFLPDCEEHTPSNLLVEDYDLNDKLKTLSETYKNTRFSVFLYANKEEFKGSKSIRSLLDGVVFQGVRVDELRDFSTEWSESYYSDGIHPTAEGANALANILKKIVEKQKNIF